MSYTDERGGTQPTSLPPKPPYNNIYCIFLHSSSLNKCATIQWHIVAIHQRPKLTQFSRHCPFNQYLVLLFLFLYLWFFHRSFIVLISLITVYQLVVKYTKSFFFFSVVGLTFFIFWILEAVQQRDLKAKFSQ